MAQGIRRKIEILFAFGVIMIFCLVSMKYYEHFLQGMYEKIFSKTKEKVVYMKYLNQAKKINLYAQGAKIATSVPVLVYHGIVEGAPENDEEISLASFEEQMFQLKQSGYQTISLKDFHQFVNDNVALPEKSFILTFDDGRRDSYYPVDPILKALDYKAAMFVITNNILTESPSRYYLNVEELKQMIDSGRWEIESHGRDDHDYIEIDSTGNVGRFMSNKKWLAGEQRLETGDEYKDRITEDLLNSKNDLKNILGVDSIAYALPGGDHGQRVSNYAEAEKVIDNVLAQAFPITFYQFDPDQRLGYYRSNYSFSGLAQYFFRRIKVTSAFDAAGLINSLKASEEKELPYLEGYVNKENWIRGWGSLQFDNGRMILQTNGEGNSAAAFLDGSIFWGNYSCSAYVQLSEGLKYSILARVKNGKDYIGCTFDNNIVKAFFRKGDFTEIIKEEKLQDFDVNKINNVGIDITDESVECTLNNRAILTSDMKSHKGTGGVGFSVFSENASMPATLTVFDNLSVFSL